MVANYSTYWVRIGTPLFFEDTGVEVSVWAKCNNMVTGMVKIKELYNLLFQRDIDDLHYFECGSRRACFQEPHNCRGT